MTSNTMPPAVVDRLVSVHGKLLQLVEAMTELQGQIEYGGADGMMSWQDILAKYSLLTSYTHSVFDLLVSPPSVGKAIEAQKAALGVEKPAYRNREEQRLYLQQEAQAWKRTLAQCLVHPGTTVEQERDFIVGVLLRTKQIPEIEAQEATLLQSIPPTSNPTELYSKLKSHEDLSTRALAACKRLRNGIDEREFQWKTRAVADDDEDDHDDDDLKPPRETHQPKYSTEELVRYMQTGVLPR